MYRKISEANIKYAELPMKIHNIDDFEYYLRVEKRLHENTLQRYVRSLKVYASDNEFTEKSVKSFVVFKQKQSEACANHYAKAFKHYGCFMGIGWVKDIKVLTEHPNEYDLLSSAELWNLIQLEPYTNKYSVFFLLMASTGRRSGELVRLVKEDLRNSFVHIKSKTKEQRKCAVPISVWKVIDDYIGKLDSNYLFPNHQRSGYLSNTALNIEFKRRLKTLNINKKTRLHDLRHHYITRQVRNNPLPHVQHQVGHKRLNTTQRYIHPNEEDLITLTQNDSLFRNSLQPTEYLRQFISIAERYGILHDPRFTYTVSNNKLSIAIKNKDI